MILSIHIPKTAGTSIRNVLQVRFGASLVLFYWEITDALSRVQTEVPPGAACIHGHFQPDRLARQYPHAQLMTWIRDPVERVTSAYFHHLRNPEWRHPVCQELHQRRLSLVEYAAIPLVRDEMSRFFGSRSPADFSFIGVVERFDESFRRLRAMLGLGAIGPRRDNVNPARLTERYDLDPAVRQEILALNVRDAELYRECLERFDRRPI